MNPINKIAVIGGTGKAGVFLIKYLLQQGYIVKALVRNPAKLNYQHRHIDLITGNVTSYENVKSLITGCDAVISTLGLGSPPSEATVFSEATRNILRAMTSTGVKRYVAIAGLNVDTPGDNKGPETKAATQWMYSHYPDSTKDRQLEYNLLRDSSVEWTLVRLPIIEQTDVESEIAVSLKDCPGQKVSATSLALFLISQLKDKTYIRSAPFIANV
ncbi:NAD(P)-dependent oxidoreductase [Chryseosolibacter indicus]|uniref:NAD(P)H-binding protein n=1 Tax=Chryseosolibacter indicus TaxID=2782351 RepID=A0ABS5VWJ3_9BACT|nr:NAD(P)H-binding protein [Chryseosolibacter indicus]MBT1705793.1 NAD(P)H-binding protein [Chryseosolibacter indicus]